MAKKKQNTKKVEPKQRKLGRYVLLFVVVLVAGVQLRHVEFQEYLPSFEVKDELEISEVIVDGSFVYSDPKKLQREIESRLKSDFLRLNLEGIRQALLADPWYQSVSVERIWPATLKIRVVEHQPIARWNDDGFINRTGDVVKVAGAAQLRDLPALKGKDIDAHDIAEKYLTMSQLLNREGLYISIMSVDQSGDWSLQLNRQFEVKLGRNYISERLDNFIGLYSGSLSERKEKIAGIDMRYRSGAAVSWKASANEQQEIAGRY